MTSDRILNQDVILQLRNHVAAPYQLDAVGTNMVLSANTDLGDDYASTFAFQRPPEVIKKMTDNLINYAHGPFKIAVDVCCGTAYLSEHFVKEGVIQKSVAVDLNSSAIDYVRTRVVEDPSLKIEAKYENIMDLKLPENADLVFGASFLHHLPDNQIFMQKAFDLLKPGGIFYLVHEPSKSAEFLQNPVGWIRRRLFGYRAGPLCDVWLYTSHSLQDLCERAGFENIQIVSSGLITTVVGFVGYVFWQRLLRRPQMPHVVYQTIAKLQTIERKLFWFLPHDSFASLAVLARRPL